MYDAPLGRRNTHNVPPQPSLVETTATGRVHSPTTMPQVTILGAIAGDVIGSAYEFRPTKDYHFPLLTAEMDITDDSIMTLAVADWLLTSPGRTAENLTQGMRRLGRSHPCPKGSYGGRFSQWLQLDDMGPYRSWGNGSAMRVSPVGFAAQSLDEALALAKTSAAVTHNHPEGIKGAQATAAAIYLAREGQNKEAIRDYLTRTFGYDLSRPYAAIKPTYRFDESCLGTVPEALIAFLESHDYEDAIRLTVALGGDADTMGAITGGVAAAYYKDVPEQIAGFARKHLPTDLADILRRFEETYG